MENAAENKLLSRIKKILAIANDMAATEHERDTAMTMAYNLMARHNITDADLQEGSTQEAREKQSFTMCGDIWNRSICHGVAELFFCNYYYITKQAGQYEHHFTGKQSNVAIATYMSEYVIRSIKRESVKLYKGITTPNGRSFAVGATVVIRERIDALLKSDIENSPGTALVLVSLHTSEAKANDQWLADNGIILRTSKAKASRVNGEAYAGGAEFGKSVSLAPQIGKSSATGRLALN